MRSLSLKAKFVVISLINIASVAALAFFGNDGIKSALHLKDLGVVSKVIQRQMESDMMHDTMKSDVLSAISALEKEDAKELKAIARDTKEHGENFIANIESAQEENLSSQIRKDFEEIYPKVKFYDKISNEIVHEAIDDLKEGRTPSKAKALLPEFKKSFKDVEVSMEALSGNIEKWSDEITAEGEAKANIALEESFIMSVISILIAIFLPIFAIYMILKPMGKIAGVIDAVSEEDISGKVPYLHRKDEIGKMAVSTDKLKSKVTEAFKLKQMVDKMPINIMTADPNNNFVINYANETTIKTLKPLEKYLPITADKLVGSSFDIFHKNPSHQRNMLADDKHLPHRAKIKIGPEVIDLNVSAIYDKDKKYVGPMVAWTVVTHQEKMADDFEASVGGVVKTVTGASEQLQHSSTVLKSSMEQLSASAREISHRVQESSQIVDNATQESERTTEVVNSLNEAAGKVSAIIGLINNIASQTNLLALNATIEAARAGEAGKGFTVVANEVKELAGQTANAIQEISKQIEEMQSKSKTAFAAIDNISGIIKQINEVASTIAGAVEEQQAAIQEIAHSVVGDSAGNGMFSGASVNTSNSVYGLSIQLSEQSSVLQQQVDEFIDKVRKG